MDIVNGIATAGRSSSDSELRRVRTASGQVVAVVGWERKMGMSKKRG